MKDMDILDDKTLQKWRKTYLAEFLGYEINVFNDIADRKWRAIWAKFLKFRQRAYKYYRYEYHQWSVDDATSEYHRRVSQFNPFGPAYRIQIGSDEAKTIRRLRRLVLSWCRKSRHRSCWYYPDIFRKMAKLLKVSVPLYPDMPREEFERGCRRFTAEKYGPVRKRTRQSAGQRRKSK